MFICLSGYLICNCRWEAYPLIKGYLLLMFIDMVFVELC